MKNLDSIVAFYKKKFQVSGIANPLNDIRVIIQECTGLSTFEQIIHKSDNLSKKKINLIHYCLRKRAKRIPTARILKKSYFRDFSLRLCNDNFIPRSDSEILIDSIINSNLKFKKILEIGTGSGALVISLLKAFSNCTAVATDINYESIYMAKKNSILNNVNKKVKLICCNWLDVFEKINFDIIVSNPPYIETSEISKLDPEVRNHDPLRALDGGYDGLDGYRNILSALRLKAKKGLIVVFEIGFNQAAKVSSLMSSNDISVINTFKDYNNKDRCLIGIKNK